MTQKNFYSTSEIAQVLGISRVAVFKKIKQGKIKAEKIGRNYAIPKSEYLSITGKILSTDDKNFLIEGIKKTIKEYGYTLKKLGND